MPLAWLLLLMSALLFQQPTTVSLRAQAPTASTLDFEFFRIKVQPILLAKREGRVSCASCHMHGTPMRLQELAAGATTWNEEQSRRNFQAVAVRIQYRTPHWSKLLIHPLASEAGGTFYHNGGKHWSSVLDPEWQTLAHWACGRKATDEMLPITHTCPGD